MSIDPPAWQHHPLLLGTSSFSSPDWMGVFYPKGTRPSDFLRFYAGRYATVEIDATYYAIPSEPTVRGWAGKTPEDFVIAAKFPRDIVHAGAGRQPDPDRLLDPDATYEIRDEFLEVMQLLGPRLGPLLLQFPWMSSRVFDSSRPFLDRLDRFLSDLPAELSFAVEVRNADWVDSQLTDLLRAHGVALVLTDQAGMPHADEVAGFMDPVTAGFSYVRLLGDRIAIEKITTSWEREVIDQGERLQRWADVLATLLEREVPTLTFANNHYAGHAPATLARLRRMITAVAEEKGLPAPEMIRPSTDLFGD